MTTDALFHAFLADLTANDVPPAKAAVTARYQSNVATAFAGVVARLIREQMDEALAPLVAEARHAKDQRDFAIYLDWLAAIPPGFTPEDYATNETPRNPYATADGVPV